MKGFFFVLFFFFFFFGGGGGEHFKYLKIIVKHSVIILSHISPIIQICSVIEG